MIEEPITRSVLRSEVREIVTEIVGTQTTELAHIMNNAFAHQQKYMDEKFDGLQSQLNGTNRRIDNHVLDYVRQSQHDKLEKRVSKLELA